MHWRLFLLLVLFITDRLLKNSIWYTPPQGGVFLHPTLNRDISFSLQLPPVLADLLIPALGVIIVLLLYVLVQSYRKIDQRFFWWGLIVIGAVSNFLDRVTLGGVLDYIDVGFWPVFNVSDMYVFFGTVVLIAGELLRKFSDHDAPQR